MNDITLLCCRSSTILLLLFYYYYYYYYYWLIVIYLVNYYYYYIRLAEVCFCCSCWIVSWSRTVTSSTGMRRDAWLSAWRTSCIGDHASTFNHLTSSSPTAWNAIVSGLRRNSSNPFWTIKSVAMINAIYVIFYWFLHWGVLRTVIWKKINFCRGPLLSYALAKLGNLSLRSSFLEVTLCKCRITITTLCFAEHGSGLVWGLEA